MSLNHMSQHLNLHLELLELQLHLFWPVQHQRHFKLKQQVHMIITKTHKLITLTIIISKVGIHHKLIVTLSAISKFS